jgi:bacterioferritin
MRRPAQGDPGPSVGRPLESASSTAHADCGGARRQREETTMQGKQTVIDALNAGLTIELTAINQYFCQSKMCRNWGLNRLAAKHYHESLGEMKHAELLIDRIIFLEGAPEIARYDVIRVGTNIPEQLKNDLELEMKGVRTYNDAIALCLRENDGGSRELLEKILVESEEHVDWLESQLDLIEKMGLENYLVTQVGEDPEPSH